jgi:hypothetical protein
MQDEALRVEERHIEGGAEADDGAIAVARALSARDCGASQSEMRKARKEYLAEFLARFERDHLTRPSPSDVEREAIARMVEARRMEHQEPTEWDYGWLNACNALEDDFLKFTTALSHKAVGDGGLRDA